MPARAANVEFRLEEIEHLPVADNSVDVIISNCVINLSPDKGRVFKEAYRLLKPGGHLAVSDVVAGLLNGVGFRKVDIKLKAYSRELVSEWFPESGSENYVASADIEAVKPA